MARRSQNKVWKNAWKVLIYLNFLIILSFEWEKLSYSLMDHWFFSVATYAKVWLMLFNLSSDKTRTTDDHTNYKYLWKPAPRPIYFSVKMRKYWKAVFVLLTITLALKNIRKKHKPEIEVLVQ